MLEISLIGLATAFLGGAISFLSPCVLPLVPGYLSYIAGHSLSEKSDQSARRGAITLSIVFVLGFSTVFVLIGAGASVVGRLFLQYRTEANMIGGALVLVFGVFMTGLIRIPVLQRDFRFHPALRGGTFGAAYLLGAAFAFGWTPCIGPVLGAIFAVTASSASSGGTLLLATYSMGLGVPFVLAAIFVTAFTSRLGTMRKIGRALQIPAGAVMIIMGVLMIDDRMTDVALWFLDTFPILSRIG